MLSIGRAAGRAGSVAPMSNPMFALIDRVEYLTFERDGQARHEWVGGEIFAMTGGSARHNRISGRLFARLLPGAESNGCRAYVADMKVVTADFGYYPDVMVVCDPDLPGEYHEERPCLIAEVLSPSTADRDRREKKNAYLTIPTLAHLLLIRQDDTQIEHYFREPDGRWNHHQLGPDDDIVLRCPELRLPVMDLYIGLGLDPDQPAGRTPR